MRVMMVFFLASIMASAQSRPCNPKQMESEVRAVINRVMELRSRQDPRFLSFYADDEYSFPGESWSFQGRERIASREGEMKLARQSGISWRMDLRDVHLKVGCETSWIAATVHVEQIDSNGTVRRRLAVDGCPGEAKHEVADCVSAFVRLLVSVSPFSNSKALLGATMLESVTAGRSVVIRGSVLPAAF